PGLVEAEADAKSARFRPKRCKADDPLDAIDVNQIGRGVWAKLRLLDGWKQLPADKPAVVGIAGKIGAVAIGDGQRVAGRNAGSGDIVGQPVQAERRDNEAAYLTIISEKRQCKLDHPPGNRETDGEFANGKGVRLQRLRKVGPSGDVDRLAI